MTASTSRCSSTDRASPSGGAARSRTRAALQATRAPGEGSPGRSPLRPCNCAARPTVRPAGRPSRHRFEPRGLEQGLPPGRPPGREAAPPATRRPPRGPSGHGRKPSAVAAHRCPRHHRLIRPAHPAPGPSGARCGPAPWSGSPRILTTSSQRVVHPLRAGQPNKISSQREAVLDRLTAPPTRRD